MNYNHQHHRNRRSRLIAEMRARSGGGIAAIPTAPEALRNADTHYPYRPDSHFYYLAGFPEPEAVVILIAGTEAGDSRQILFCRDKNPEREIWDGFRYGPDAARERFGFDEAYPIDALDEKVVQLLENQRALHFPVAADPEWDARAMRWLNAVRAKARGGIAAPERIQD